MKNWTLRRVKAGLAGMLGIVLLAGGSAAAQDLDVIAAEAVKGEKSAIGLGAAYIPDYEGSSDYEAAPFVQLRFSFDNDMYFSLLGNTARFNLIPSKSFHLGPMVRYRMERDDVDNDRVDAMEDIDAAVEVGGFVSFNAAGFILMVSAAQDVADAHDGWVANGGIGYRFGSPKTTSFTLFATTTYASEDYMETYFGVTPADAIRSGLPVYEAGDADWKDVGGGFVLQHNFSKHWGILGVAKYTKLLNDAKDSPVVDEEGDEDQGLAGVLVNYRF